MGVTRTWQEVRECLDFDPVAASARRSVPEPAGAKAPKAPRSTVPPPEPWMGRLLPDAAEPGAPAITGAFFGGFGAFLGVLRGAAVALLTDRFPDLPRSRAFAIGFAASAPWYVSLLGISGVLSVYSARAERAGRPAQLELSESHPACDLG